MDKRRRMQVIPGEHMLKANGNQYEIEILDDDKVRYVEYGTDEAYRLYVIDIAEFPNIQRAETLLDRNYGLFVKIKVNTK